MVVQFVNKPDSIKVIYTLALVLDQSHPLEPSTKEIIITVAVSGHRVVNWIED